MVPRWGWLISSGASEREKSDLTDSANTRQEAIALTDSIFRAYDIRGIVGETLSEDIARQIGLAIAKLAGDKGLRRIAVARDGRLSAPRMSAALISGLRRGGCDVVDIGRVPTPVLYFATFVLDGVRAGVMVTGSHNPPDYNGFKVVLDRKALFGEQIMEIRRSIPDRDPDVAEGSLEEVDLAEEYLQRIAGDIRPRRPLRVVVDAGNGVTGELGPELLRRIGCEVDELHTRIDGTFPNHHPDPGVPENMTDLIRRVGETGADIGFGFDGDGDRVGVVTPQGELIYPDHLMMAYAEELLARRPGSQVIFDVKCTANLARMVRRLGGQPEMYKTGHSLIKDRMQATGAPLAGEMSGHIFFADRWYGFDDGIYAAARLVEILAARDEDADVFFARFPRDHSTPEISIAVPEEHKFRVIEELVREGDFGEGERCTLDGIRVDYEDGWGLVRASNTSPKLVARYEGRDAGSLSRIRERFERSIDRVLERLD